MTTVAQLSEILQSLLIDDAKQLGRSSGFIQRERKFNGASFAQALVFGWQANPRASLEELCQSARACGVEISPQGLQERLNPAAAHFLERLLQQSLTYRVTSEGEPAGLLERFTGIYLQDTSVIGLPPELVQIWRGCGHGQGKSASLKLQTLFEYKQGALHLSLQPGAAHDTQGQATHLPARSVRIADSAYFKVAVFKDFNQHGIGWLSRVPATVTIWQDHQTLPIGTWLAQAEPSTLDVEVHLTRQRLPCRLLAMRVPEKVAQQRRARVTQDAKDQGHLLRPETLALCEWTVMATNLPPEDLTLQEGLILLRLRWQIELLFKLWKQTFHFTAWRTSRPVQILCEVYAKLLSLVVQHWLLVLGCWDAPERSLFKAVLVLQKHAFHLATVLPSLTQLQATLAALLPSLLRCKIQKRKARPATFQLLGRASP